MDTLQFQKNPETAAKMSAYKSYVAKGKIMPRD